MWTFFPKWDLVAVSQWIQNLVSGVYTGRWMLSDSIGFIFGRKLFDFLPQKWSQSRALGMEYSLSCRPLLHYYPLDPQNAMLSVRLKSSGWESQWSPSVPLLNQLEKSLLNDVEHPLPHPLSAESSLGSLVQQCLVLGKHVCFVQCRGTTELVIVCHISSSSKPIFWSLCLLLKWQVCTLPK